MSYLVIEHAPNRADGIEDTIHLTHPQAQIEIVRSFQQQPLPNPSDYQGVILSGGPMSVCHIDRPEFDYIVREVPFIRRCFDLDIPVFGICFGHQLMAHALGGVVVRDEPHKEIGWHRLSINEHGQASKILSTVEQNPTFFQFHYDRVSILPADTQVLATSQSCHVQALSYIATRSSSVQFHPEIGAKLGAKIFSSLRQKIDFDFDIDEVIKRSTTVSETSRRQIFNNFISITI